jgi:hypothetical protein
MFIMADSLKNWQFLSEWLAPLFHYGTMRTFKMTPPEASNPQGRDISRTENECIASEMVKGLMNRPKVALISLFSGLSLLVSGQSLFVPCADCEVQDSNHAACVLQSSKDSCSHGLNSYDIFARQAFSRIGKHLGKGNLPPSHLLCRSHSLERIFLCSSHLLAI